MPHKNIEDRRRYAKEYADSHPEYREKRALKELDKCILVCSNCHRLLHNSKY